MLYLVSGYMRSGTSMLMDSLSAGGRPHGLEVRWSRERDAAMNRRHGDETFKPNESYREIALEEYGGFDFPLKYDGCLVKVMSWGLAQMRKVPHRIVFMLRDPAEIAESMERAFGEGPPVILDGTKVRAVDYPEAWAELYWRMMKAAVQAAELRRDCEGLHVWTYADVLADPKKHFDLLARSGWPIDSALAAQAVDPKRKRT